MSLGFFVTADHDGHTQVIAVSLLKDEDQVHCCVCLCACACVSERLRVSSCVCLGRETTMWMMASPDLPERLRKRYQHLTRNKDGNAG